MNISAPFIRRPTGTILLTIGIALAGIAAFFALPVAPLPAIDIPTISVQASLPGGSPETMASSVAAPLEHRLATIAGVDELTSQSGVGSSRVTMQFDLSRDIDGAARDVQAAINAARADLPTSLKANPSYQKVNPADAPVIILALTSAHRSPDEIYDQVSSVVQQALGQVEGVGNVELGGGALPAVRIGLDPAALARLGISLEDVRTAIGATNANRPKGVVEGATAYQLYTSAPSRSAADYSGIVIASRDGTVVRLSDVAHIYAGPEDVRTLGLFNGRKAVMVLISRQPNANIIQTVDSIKAALPRVRAQIPADIHIEVAVDRTTTIRASLFEVQMTLLVATVLVILVVGFFLQSIRATLIPAVAVVVSLLGTLAVMYLMGYSLDNLSLMALTVATGFVVDDAIVVLENIERHIRDGMPRLQAALTGAREVGFTVLSISVSLVAVFIPLLFMGGLIGRIFREFAATMTIAVLISLVLSLTTTPMLSALILRDNHAKRPPGRLARHAQRSIDWSHRRYTRSLDWALANRGATGLLLLGAILLNVYLITLVPKGFFPEQDTGAVAGGVRADQSISFGDTGVKLTQLVNILRHDPAVQNVVAFTGGSRAGGGFVFLILKPRGERDGARAVIGRLRPKLARVTGITLFLNPIQDMMVGGRGGNAMYQYTLKGDDPDVLATAAARLTAAMKRDKMLTDVDSDRNDSALASYVEIDKQAAARLGITATTIDAILYDGFGQRQVATIYSGVNQYHVVMGVAPQFTGSPEALSGVYLPTGSAVLSAAASPASSTAAPTASLASNGGASSAVLVAPTTSAATGTSAAAAGPSTTPATMAPLSAIATWNVRAAPAQINHQDASPSITISFGTADGVSLSQASKEIDRLQSTLQIPASVRGGFAGSAKVFQQSTSSTPLLIVAAIVTIYLVLGILYESMIHPLTVLSTLPAAGVGAAAALLITRTQFDLIGLIGLILLIGIVKKNAIMMIDFAIARERAGMAPVDAIREAALLRFRPILMTTLAAGLGALPLAIGFGDGSELRRPLGIAIIGGLIVSQFVTLLTTPVVYLALDGLRFRSRRRRPTGLVTT